VGFTRSLSVLPLLVVLLTDKALLSQSLDGQHAALLGDYEAAAEA
jgi:hypothetical protein